MVMLSPSDPMVWINYAVPIASATLAGIDEMVLICQGSSARLTPETEKLPVDATIIGIVDSVNVENNIIFSARE